ncbi:ParB/RepB/Spo0J family partition protein [Acidocella sp.]|uniref:ParB/RepB/Spo0J family partition protein n=1 Tax=Acidocella sp. TaxID=50710 RepID=UPI00260E1B24|nr:ParB/RepB/Spo0J family partition protein [Acidocella sp.]MDD2794391.1 ParB/RepB/Spo0J family partition protein [Acidocella sp.]
MAPKPKLTPEQIAAIAARLEADPSLTAAAEAQAAGVHEASLSRALAKHRATLPGAAPGASIVELHHASLHPSAYNPRKTFDDDKIEELAASIAKSGLLQNLVARPAFAPGQFEIIDGERRWRAIKLLIERNGHADLIPVKIIETDAATHQMLSLLANLQRENVPPLEEADGIAALHAMDPQTWTTAEIAASIGRSQRYVQHRLAIANNLVVPAKVLLRRGYITIEAARLLAAEPHTTQLTALADYDCAEITEATEFDDAETDYTITTEEIAGAISWIHRQAEQEKADAAKAATPPPEAQMRLDAPGRAERADAGDAGDDDAPTAEPAATAPAEDEPAAELFTRAHIYHAHQRKTQALQRAVAEAHTHAMRLVIMALLGPQSVVLLSRKYGWSDDMPEDDEQIENIITRHLAGVEPPEYLGETKQELALWKHLCGLEVLALTELFAAVVARQVHTPSGHQALLGDNPLAEAVAKTLGVAGDEADHGLTIRDEQDLAGLRKPLLLAVAEATHTAGITSSTRTADVTSGILGRLLNHDYILPTLKFASTKAIESAIKKMVA